MTESAATNAAIRRMAVGAMLQAAASGGGLTRRNKRAESHHRGAAQ